MDQSQHDEQGKAEHEHPDAEERGAIGRAVNEIGHTVRVALMKVYGPARLDDEHDPVEQLKREHGDAQPEPEEETPFDAGMRAAKEREERFRAEQRKGDRMSEGPAGG